MLVVGLAGCATTAPIAMGNDTYMISQTSAGGLFKSMGSLKSEVITRANAFAASKGKVAVPVAATESPAIPGRQMPNFEYQFQLVDSADPRASGGSLVPRADTVIEVHSPSPARATTPSSTKDVYTELLKLDDLKKRGLITDAEFSAEKAKLLGESH